MVGDDPWRTAILAFWEEDGLPHRSINPTRRRCIWERDGRQCGICGAAVAWVDLEIDHIVLWMDGGPTVPSNLRATHHRCNADRAAPLHRVARQQRAES